jgi:uncharacterized protein
MALELRPNCEYCDVDLPPASGVAMICSYECTFCASCVDAVLTNVCPNCGGGFTARPIRPAQEWRPGLSLSKRPPSDRRHNLSYQPADIAALSARLRSARDCAQSATALSTTESTLISGLRAFIERRQILAIE